MTLDPPFRLAGPSDARAIAELVDIASEGVAAIEWQAAAEREPGVAGHFIGDALGVERGLQLGLDPGPQVGFTAEALDLLVDLHTLAVIYMTVHSCRCPSPTSRTASPSATTTPGS